MTTATAPRHAAEGSEAFLVRMISYGFTRAELADRDRMPEQLVLSHLADTPTAGPDLSQLRWWKDRPRRHDLAFHRLRVTGQIDFVGGVWRTVSQDTPVPAPVKKQVQRSLF